MSTDQLTIGKVQFCWNESRTCLLKYTVEMSHKGLNEHKLISAPRIDNLQMLIDLQAEKWAESWTEKVNTKAEEAVKAISALITVGKINYCWNVSHTRLLKYTIEMHHKGLNEHKLISAPEFDILFKKIDSQAQKWADSWNLAEAKRKNIEEKEASQEKTNTETEKAVKAIRAIDDLLIHITAIDHTINWENLKKKELFSEKMPSKPKQKQKKIHPTKPQKENPVFSFFDLLLKSRKWKKIKYYDDKYVAAISDWEKHKKAIDESNKNLDQDYNLEIAKWNEEVKNWEKRKSIFLQDQDTFNVKIDQKEESYLKLNTEAITEYCDMVLNNSHYPETFPKNYELEYNPENKILIVEYKLPSMDCFPTIKEIKYIALKKELKETNISESQLIKMFDDAMYKITLRTIHELFNADVANALEAISFNGWVNEINKATGRRENNCILSIQVKKSSFIEIDLENVDPKSCFKKLKGVASSKLSSLTPIQPILQISNFDKRFVEGYEVVNKMDNSTNLAAMDWEDFEHLIREIFEKEFQINGGEVKITQASRDGGVDAIAFDPDPIRGGKIVIQAKRYTNTVGVSAVRDLYGTTMNEGATKGILVSTADYGPDAYAFARGKPLTLLNGSNLLYLLEKHGYHAKIDLKEAKIILAENEKGSKLNFDIGTLKNH